MIKASVWDWEVWLQDFLNKESTENAERYSLPYFRKFRPEIYVEVGL